MLPKGLTWPFEGIWVIASQLWLRKSSSCDGGSSGQYKGKIQQPENKLLPVNGYDRYDLFISVGLLGVVQSISRYANHNHHEMAIHNPWLSTLGDRI